MFIDTHTHLYLEDFEADRAETVQRALDQDVRYMLLPNIDSGSTAAMLQTASLFPDCCLPMMGLHPTSVKENYRDELAFIEKELSSGKYCAVGEVGIDLYWDKSFFLQQQDVFHREIDLAFHYQLPLVIHTRNSLEVTIEILNSSCHAGKVASVPHDRGVFHCFPGTVDQAMEVIDMGFYLGIGGVVTYKNSLMAKVVECVSLDHLVLETDAPFLSPHPKRGLRNESAFIPVIAKKIAEIKGLAVKTVEEATTINAKKLFQLK